MKEGNSTFFVSPTEGLLGVEQMLVHISSFIASAPEAFYRVVIGTDSQTKRINNEAEIDFVTAVVVHKIGHGARYFWRREKQKKKYVLREKIYTETIKSLEFAEQFVPMLRSKISASAYDLEIHIDVGPVGPTREMIKEVVGMVRGSGYTVRTKPESYGASSVADRHT
ncbi:MAG: ribonuclease H-like YkuK family protein [Candidatus Blackburnbacteria bacterium]|nr:ribonuclease H-like YkuK family protein [Candidatus Blackburnbacteria bacterium]